MAAQLEKAGLGLDVKINQEQDVTIDEVVSEANSIWKDTKTLYKSDKFKSLDNRDELILEYFQNRHPEFTKAYPIVLRYMCQLQNYDSRAFTKYLGFIKHNPWKTEEDYLESQVDYLTLLYKYKTPKWKPKDIENLKTNFRRILKREHNDFKKRLDEYNKTHEEKAQQLKKMKTAETVEFIKKIGETGLQSGGTFRLEYEVPTEEYPQIDISANDSDSEELKCKI